MSKVADVSLDQKYTATSGVVFMTGIQALVRLPMIRRQLDQIAGLNTAGFISGYRGSPLGGYDQELWNNSQRLTEHHIKFEAGINEDLAATAVWGSQQLNLFPDAKYDGVFGIWYGKGPGVDRSGDALKHANSAGTSEYGGVLALAGDDHTCKSSTLAHQSEYAFIDANIPVLNPSGVQELIEYGIKGWEMSRFSGVWVAVKTIAETLDSSATVELRSDKFAVIHPEFDMPDGGLHIRWPDTPLEQESRLHRYKIYAALEFCRVNNFNRIVLDSPSPKLGIATTGKSYLDVMQALSDLGIDENEAEAIGLRIYKIGMPWPLEPSGTRQFAKGLREVLVVEEKRAVIENQLKEQLYNWESDVRPMVVGKFDENHNWILPSEGELTPARIARVLADRISRFYTSSRIKERLDYLEQKESSLNSSLISVKRTPHFCSGCPHNTSTKVPEGSRAVAGIGCHYMVHWMDRRTETFTQMGGEGASWIGQAPFTGTKHIFANIGDGTYYHSGLLAIRASIASGVNITYKLLVNDAVAMTGGQPVDGNPSTWQMAHQLYGEGASKIVIVAEDVTPYSKENVVIKLPPGVEVFDRDELPRIQLEIREQSGTSIIIYDQVCATEKRRRRKRGTLVDPDYRVVINSEVCEGCGDCSVQSNCLAVIPLETALGRKRTIDQSACNKDLSCLKGFCPSFVVVKGARLKKPKTNFTDYLHQVLPEPLLPKLSRPYAILITGVGGTGVVTVSALLGMAAHIDGRGSSVLDMTGLAQKYGAVSSHIQISESVGEVSAVRIAAGGADVLLGCDSIVSAGFDALSKISNDRTHIVLNNHQSSTAQFIHNPDLAFPADDIERQLRNASSDNIDAFDATSIAEKILGNAIGSNLMLVGFAWQRGLLPLSLVSIKKAIALNGVAVEFNYAALDLGRQLAHRTGLATDLLKLENSNGTISVEQSLDDLLVSRQQLLVAYQGESYAEQYSKVVKSFAESELKQTGCTACSQLVAKNLYKLMAYKDEYEVARLLTSKSFKKQLVDQFEPGFYTEYQLAPPFLAKLDKVSGRPIKRSIGPWIQPFLVFLKKLAFLRGSLFDPFGYQHERKLERQLIRDYLDDIAEVEQTLVTHNLIQLKNLLNWPESIRGYGPVKLEGIERAMQERQVAKDKYLNQSKYDNAA